MRYQRCKCGKAEGWTTDSFQDCQGCDECGTTFSGHPDHHKPKIEHEWAIRYSTTTGEPEKRMCTRCHARAPLVTADTPDTPHTEQSKDYTK